MAPRSVEKLPRADFPALYTDPRLSHTAPKPPIERRTPAIQITPKHLGHPQWMAKLHDSFVAPRVGLEPTTYGLTVRRSTN